MDEKIEVSSTSSTESLEDLDWDGLLELVKEKEEKLNLAGTYGLKLFEQLNEAQNHIEDMRVKHESELEKLVQEIFHLKNRLELRDKSSQEESNELQKQLQKKHEEDIEEVISKMKKEQSLIKKDKDLLAAELDQSQLRERQALEENQRLEDKIAELQAEVKKKVTIVSPGKSELQEFELKEQNCILEEEIEKLKSEFQKVQNGNQSLSLELKSKINEIENLNKEIEELEIKSTCFYNHLQKAREESNELKAELDTLKNVMGNSGHLNQGNSLFGEVEDERRDMEKKLSSFQIKYDSLSKSHAFLVNQNRNMKAQVLSLLQMNSNKVNKERISQLERALSQANAENQSLIKKISEAESKQEFSVESLKALSKDVPHVKSNRDMIDFLLIQIDETKGKHNKLREEFDHLSMVKLAESEKLRKSEQKLYETGVQLDKHKNDNMKLKLKLEETKNKLQGEIQKRKMVEEKFNYDSKDDVVPLGIVNETQTKKILPPTLAKAQEKAQEKNSISQKSNQIWNSNSKKRESIFKNLNISKKETPKPVSRKDLNVDHKDNEIENISNLKLLSSVSSTPKNEIFSPGNVSSGHQKNRKVSFKEQTETIPECTVNDTITENNGNVEIILSENKENSSKVIPNSSENKPSSALKKKGNLPLRNHLQEQQQNVNNTKETTTKLSATRAPVKTSTNSEQDCKMQ